jgi:peptidoglycan/LPS O-acetylase OafA/YrhL
MQLFTGGVVDAPVYYLILLSLFTIVFWVLAKAPAKIRPFLYIGVILLAFMLEYSAANFKYFTDFDPAIKNCYARFVELIKYGALGLLFSYLPKTVKSAWLLVGIALIAFIAYQSVANLLPPWGFDYAGFKYFWGSITVFAVFLLFSMYKSGYPGSGFIILLGKYAFGVYLIHYVLLELLLVLYPSILYVIIAYPLFFALLFVSFCYCLCVLIAGLSSGKLAYLVQ